MKVSDIKEQENTAVPTNDAQVVSRKLKATALHVGYLKKRVQNLDDQYRKALNNDKGQIAKEIKRIKEYILDMTKETRISTGRGRFENPYLLGTNADYRYAGHPDNLKEWSSAPMQRMYIQLKAILARSGLHFDMMYASKYQHSGNRYNFAVIGANQRFVWRKYDPSPGAGMNWVYIDGNQMNTSTFLDLSDQRQDKLLKPLKESNE